MRTFQICKDPAVLSLCTPSCGMIRGCSNVNQDRSRHKIQEWVDLAQENGEEKP